MLCTLRCERHMHVVSRKSENHQVLSFEQRFIEVLGISILSAFKFVTSVDLALLVSY